MLSRIDRYLLGMYVRTMLICFCSLAGIFVVFHAFNNIQELSTYARRQGSFVGAFVSYYGPFLLAIFDATNAILAVFSLIFTVALLKRNGELTALLAAGLNHGRILRPMLIAAVAVIVIAIVNREFLMPNWKDQLGAKAKDLDRKYQRTMQPVYDRMTGIQFHGRGIILLSKEIVSPALMIRSDIPGIGPQIHGARGYWKPASADRPAGFLIEEVTQPEEIDSIPSTGFHDRKFVLTAADTPWLETGQCFVVSNISFENLVTGTHFERLASTRQLINRVQNPSVYSGPDTEIVLHGRFVRPWLDMSLVLIGLPLVITRGDKNLFVVAGWGLGLIAIFFFVKTFFTILGSSETFVTPSIAAWGPFLVFGPLAYSRLRRAASRT